MFVNAIMYYKVRDPTSAVANVDDYSGSARLLAATTLRNVLGTKNLGDILSERESIAQDMQVTSSPGPQILIIWTRFSPSCLESNWSRDPREPWTRPPRPGGSRWRGWRWVHHGRALHGRTLHGTPCQTLP